MYRADGVYRLYIHFGANDRNIHTISWFEVINDRLRVFVRVHRLKPTDYYDSQTAKQYKVEIEKQFREIIEDCERGREKVPLHKRLRDDVVPVYDEKSMKHQVDALRFCCSMKVSALYADTSTGKSKIAIDLAVSRFEAGRIKKVLVFLPVATKANFQEQIKTWCTCRDIYWKLVGHESISASDTIFLSALNYTDSKTMIIIDESHAIKTPTTNRARRVALICEKTNYKLVMTGTPVTEHVHDLYMQYQVLSPQIIGAKDWQEFEESYMIMGGRLGNEIIGYKNLEYLTSLVEPYTYQISKEECLDLPAKHFTTHYCDLNEGQARLYEREKRWLLKVIQGNFLRVTDIFQSFVRMQQICSGSYRSAEGYTEDVSTNKLELLSVLPSNEQAVIFCKFIFELEMLVKFYGREKCALFSGQNPRKRDSELKEFIKGKRQYFIATMQSGGTGLNGLQEVCRHMAFFSNSFSYFHRKQSIGRIDRVGQQSEMYVHDLCTTAKIDEKIMQNLIRKGNLVDEIRALMADKTKLKKDIENL
ncbi:MAG: DEAD/DEAH box helicase [Odoribacteraceae bacterium]|nr:DEAD/DEAH box helicase [Odoribacteraceae bacterium]